MMSADEDYLDLFLVESLELFGYVASCGIPRQYPIVEISPDQEEVWPVFKSKVDQDIEGVLKVSLPLESPGTVLDGGGIEMIVSCKKHMYCHYLLSSQAARTVRLLVQPLASILNLEANEPEAFPGIKLDLSRGERAIPEIV